MVKNKPDDSRLITLSSYLLLYVYKYLKLEDVLTAEFSLRVPSEAGQIHFRLQCKRYIHYDNDDSLKFVRVFGLIGQHIKYLTVHFEKYYSPLDFEVLHNVITNKCRNLKELTIFQYRRSVTLPTENINFAKGLTALTLRRNIANDFYIREYVRANKRTLNTISFDVGSGLRLNALLDDTLVDNDIRCVKIISVYTDNDQRCYTNEICNPEDFRKLVNLCQRVETIEFEQCFFLTSDMIAEIARLPNLRFVTFEECPIRPGDVVKFVRTASKSLRRIELSYCPYISYGIKAVVEAINENVIVDYIERYCGSTTTSY